MISQISADRDEINQLKSRYGALVDQLAVDPRPDDAEQVARLFTSDAVVDMTFSKIFGIYRGHAEIVKLYTELMAPNYHWMWHSFHTPLITVDGDQATGRWTIYSLVLPKSREKTDAPHAFHGHYDDQFRRTAEGWKHSRLRGVNTRP